MARKYRKKKIKRSVSKGVAHICATFNNTVVTITDMGGGTSEITLTTRTLTSLENMIDDGLLDYASMLDGDVDVGIDFSENGSVTMTITQE